MTLEKIKELAKMLGATKIRNSGNSIMFNCPFAPYTHYDGKDIRPSFGIKAGKTSVYHCFSCGQSGQLSYLPFILFNLSNIPQDAIKEFISEYDYVPDYRDSSNPIEDISNSNLANFILDLPLLTQPYFKLSNMEINQKIWQLRFDPNKNAVVFPIFDADNNLVTAKGRVVGTKNFFQYYDYPIKKKGLWYGINFKYRTRKVILCEGERDAIKLSYRNLSCYASFGASITFEQCVTLRRSNYNFILFFDNDDAGKEATEKIIRECKAFNTLYRVENYYGVKDPAEAVEKNLIREVLKTIKQV